MIDPYQGLPPPKTSYGSRPLQPCRDCGAKRTQPIQRGSPARPVCGKCKTKLNPTNGPAFTIRPTSPLWKPT